MNETRQFGDLATQLVVESRRSTQTDTLLKYNDPLVRQIIREQRDLEKAAGPLEAEQEMSPALLVMQTAITRNKRCLLAYHTHRTDRLRDMYWAVGGALAHILSNQDIRSKLSPHEVDYLRQYHSSVMEFRSEFSNELDVTASIINPPKDIHVLVHVVRDCGVIQTELGSIDFQKGQRFMVRKADIEHLIVQGYLEEALARLWKKPDKSDAEQSQTMAPTAVAQERLITLISGEMETILQLPNTFQELMQAASDWTSRHGRKGPFGLRVPIKYAPPQATRGVTEPYLYLTDDPYYQTVIMGGHNLRVEIFGPFPQDVPTPPPPSVLEMPAKLSLELCPGQILTFETKVSSGNGDMSRLDNGTVVDGTFWGKLDVVHTDDTHSVEFRGTRIPENPLFTPEFLSSFFNSRTIARLLTATKPTVAKCHLSVLAPEMQYCDVILVFSSFWRIGTTWPQAETVSEGRVKYFLRINPGGSLEHFESDTVVSSLYYEAIPDQSMLDPAKQIAPQNSYAMPFKDFVPHLMNVLDQFSMSVRARTSFINDNIAAFSAHENIAYRFLSPRRIAAAIDIEVSADPCIFTRIFLMFRGLTDDAMQDFSGAGLVEANNTNWRVAIGWTEGSRDPALFRVLEDTVFSLTGLFVCIRSVL